MIKTGNDYGEPEFIEFCDNQILHFHITSKNEDGMLEKIQFRKENLSETKLKILNEDRIRIFGLGKIHTVVSETDSTTEEVEISTDYVKIKPTITSFSKEEILKMEFKAEWNREKFPIIFNRDLDSLPLKEIKKRLNREGRKILLEDLQGTYFASIFNDGRRETLIGIKEITREKAILFGFPGEPFEVTAYSSKKTKQNNSK
ncbi:hypothetical protein FHG64_15980 [Antarcticibacterium flavum]|uniref:Uncharacterized protein n=1 Tax=Antarcticibacterium flavum TaxID=2058175 RepID=A0A5B7X5V4_9FLAO|nr:MULTISPECIES: hypothetical protein [Antarcticibacterium]QCY70767.1 hypothetical protein FHG64_15980 [Antarcticibacterium flavum]